MSAFRFFDPWAMLEYSSGQSASAKVANPAKGHAAASRTVTDLAALALRPAASANRAIRRKAEEERAAIVGYNGAIPRIGILEIPGKPLLLRDGRRLWRFSQAQDCTSDRAATLIDQAHWCGAVLVTDGCQLIVVERWLSSLPVETLCELRRYASGVIAALHRQPHVRRDADARSGGQR